MNIQIIAGIICILLGAINIPGVADGNVFSAFAVGWCFCSAFINFVNWFTS